MKSASMPHTSGRITAYALVSIFIASLIPILPLYAHQSDSTIGSTRSKAATHHEIVMMLMKKKQYGQAATEAHKIFEMSWPEDQEPLLLKELLLISGQFRMQGQAPMGLEFIEKNSKCFKQTPSRIAILKEKGWLYKTMNQDAKAIDCFRKAQEIEDKN